MAEITEENLQGDWFYLEEDEPLDPVKSLFWTFRDGMVTDGATGAELGTYDIEGDEARITLTPSGQATRIEIIAIAAVAHDGLSTSKLTHFQGFDEPMEVYGTMLRRAADYLSMDDLRKRL